MALAHLSNGRYNVFIDAAGAGWSSCDGYALTAWRGDAVENGDGFFIYVRDVDAGPPWSIGHQPVRRPPESAQHRWEPGRLTFVRRDAGIESRCDICVVEDQQAELRRLTFRNLGTGDRRLEITTWAEVVLADLAAHLAHPAFSKLFVRTEHVPQLHALLATRRPRSAAETPPVLVHALLDGEALEHETDRARFLGRTRRLDAPRALDGALSGTTGDVLDPIVSLRCRIDLPAGSTVRRTFLLGAAEDRTAALALVARIAPDVDAAFAAARVAETVPFDEEHAPHAEAPPRRRVPAGMRRAFVEPLQAFNGLGGFRFSGREYVLRLEPAPGGGLSVPPRPWINVVANPDFGFLASETGAGYTWSGNSREHRLTPWSNDLVIDPHSEAFWVRDEPTGEFWSLFPGPTPGDCAYEVTHAFGSTHCAHVCDGLEIEVRAFVPVEALVRFTRVTIRNVTDRERRLSVFGYAHLVVEGEGLEIDPRDGTIRAAGTGVFARVVGPGTVHATTDRARFLGAFGTVANPAALHDAAPLDGRDGPGLEPCAAHQTTFVLGARETADIAFLLGDAPDAAAAFDDIPTIDRAWHQVRAMWDDIAGAVQISTPVPALDWMVNGWATYQALACRLWARSAAYQSGGAFGFRDQLQDAAALVYAWPELTRDQILTSAAHQFVEGDVLHWWHPPHGRGLRTRFADDLLWLPWVAAFYARTTGDWEVFDARIPFVTARSLEPGEDEALIEPEVAADVGTLWEHCCRAIERSLGRGAHGLPFFGTGDWNDGLNRVGREGCGESVWMGFFLATVLADVLPICEQRGDGEHARRWARHREALVLALERTAWDGAWYRRGWYDDGTPLGTQAADECRIDALVQAWAVLSGVAPPERARQALDSVERHLVDEDARLIRLLWPPFDRTPHDPGYIKGYVPGVRENGGQYTHAALWVVRALAELGRNDRAARLLEMLCPASHARTPEDVAVYQVEPYVVAADVYSIAPHVGRGGWTWYTGSAGWLQRVALESILGMCVEAGATLVLAPCVPDDWPEFGLAYRLPGDDGTRYEIVAQNPHRDGRGVRAARLDGVPIAVEDGVARLPLLRDGRTHRVEVVLGAREAR